MTQREQILVVAQNPKVANTLVSWLGAAGYDLVMVTTFAAAKVYLEATPHLVVAELKLGEYNGLHVALRARAAGIPAIVLGPRDQVLQKDAADLGVQYISSVLRRKQLLEAAGELIKTSSASRTADEALAACTSIPTFPAEDELMWRLVSQAPGGMYLDSLGRRVLPN